MALVQDKQFLINHIRAQYLSIADDDQSRRIIRPYPVTNEDAPHYPTQELDPEFGELLTKFDSPPIPINVVEDTTNLMRKLQVSNDSVNERIMETDEEREPFDHNTLKEQTLQSHNPESKASLATLKLNHHQPEVGAPPRPSQAQSQTHQVDHQSLTPQTSAIGMKLPTFGNTKFTKLFTKSTGNTSSQSSMSSKKKKKPKVGDTRRGSADTRGSNGEDYAEKDDDDDDDDDYDEDDDDDDDYDNEHEYDYGNDDIDEDDSEIYSNLEAASQTNTESELVNLKDIEDNNESQGQDESGILVDQNYSDVNTASQMDRFDDSKYLYGDNTVSSVDDQLLLDSDFSDEDDDDIIDNALQSARLQLVQSKTPSSNTTPSRSNRNLSFDNKSKPRLRPKRSSSLSVKNQESGDSNDSLRHVQSNSNLGTLQSPPPSSPLFGFGKISEPAQPKLKSQLTELITKKFKTENKDPLEHFLFVSGEKISNSKDVIDMKVYLPNEKIIELKIRTSVTVFDTIGFILFNVTQKSPDLLSSSPLLRNPNKWCLRLVDDGEPYEGSFGLMDRTKIIASYGEDEVALVGVSDAEFQENEIKTPLPTTEHEPATSGTPSPSKSNYNNNNAIRQTNYFKSIIPRVDNDIKDAVTVKINIYKYPAYEDSTFTSLEFPLTAKLNEILLKYTKMKDLDPTDYLLKVAGEDYVLDLNDSVSSLDGSYKLEIITKRKKGELQLKKKKVLDNNTLPTINSNLTPHSLMIANDMNKDLHDQSQQQKPHTQIQPPARAAVQRRHSLSSKQFSSSFSKHGISSSFKNKNNSRTSLKSPADNAMLPNIVTAEYQKFTVWRRLPMSFINRHERTLAIDGEYVYIMPKDEKIWYENNFKTRTFHVSQIVSCKVSKRVPSNFKIVVMKTNGPKRYDFEALNQFESAEIIHKLHKLMEAYKAYNSSLS